MPALPQAARDHMSERAKEAISNTPAAEVVEVASPYHYATTDRDVMEGTAGVVDYFVFDFASFNSDSETRDVILGFEDGDIIIVSNVESLISIKWAATKSSEENPISDLFATLSTGEKDAAVNRVEVRDAAQLENVPPVVALPGDFIPSDYLLV